jgi:hypothetical protein
MSTFHLDTARLARDVDRARRAGAPDEMSYRQVAQAAGVHPSTFTRLNDGKCPDVDGLLSLLMWLNPRASIAQYARPGDRKDARPTLSPRRQLPAPIAS